MLTKPRNVISTLVALTAFAALYAAPARAQERPLLGFGPESSAAQLAAEARLDESVRASNLEEWMERMTREPFFVGAPYNYENAMFVAEQFRSWGYEVEIAEYEVLFPKPLVRHVEMLEPESFVASLEEPEISEDATSGVAGRLPTYNAYSADGDVTAELVYVNQGIPRDYEELERMGIDVAGKIVIARYGGSWRGIKPKVAHEHGAIATILYSDPRDDGFFQGDAYPKGAYRAEFGVQRGAVQDMPLYPGDPLTPGVGATADAERMTPEESPTVMKIPVLPISWGDALPLLRALEGPVAPPSWRGALPLTYHVGPGPAIVRVHLEFDWGLETAYNVIATMPGTDFPDEWVIRGNHRDGWAMGAADPISGHVAMMEEARAIGELAEAGMRPRRTIIYGSWDAEEPGLLGSTEWVEHHADELRAKAVAYINTDGSSRGFLGMGGSHTLQSFINDVARSVTDPQTGVSVWERLHASRAVGGGRRADDASDITISPLGSGSDYTPFLQHLGIASLNLGFGGEGGGGSYHSQYDSFDHYTRFGDPGFQYGAALAKTTARVTLRLANADVIPLRFSPFVNNVKSYRDEVIALLDETREQTERRNALVASDAYTLSADPTKTYVPPEAQDEVPFLNFAPVQNAITRLEASAAAYDAAYDAMRAAHAAAATAGGNASGGGDMNEHGDVQQRLNAALIQTERLMTHQDGLPRRGWFRHQIYAPGFYTGYGVKTLPGIREAIEQRGWDEASEQVERLAGTLTRLADKIDEAAALLRGS
ncbi:transferrin receptor-like dimerization domain-containing protein [Candidatus Palauibacter sp.]|uniref:transferrin receptor-like dimerization domain-containing protein n=1 Tax=Candidatus Palauibacter sp. TaxID=3101350 RepID=UPI003B024FEF